jgi:hypothetical protein
LCVFIGERNTKRGKGTKRGWRKTIRNNGNGIKGNEKGSEKKGEKFHGWFSIFDRNVYFLLYFFEFRDFLFSEYYYTPLNISVHVKDK